MTTVVVVKEDVVKVGEEVVVIATGSVLRLWWRWGKGKGNKCRG